MLSQVLTREIVYSTQFLDTPRVKDVIKSAKVQVTKRCKHNSAESVCASVWELRRVVDAKQPIPPYVGNMPTYAPTAIVYPMLD